MAQQGGDVAVGEAEPDRVGDLQQAFAAIAVVERVGILAEGGGHRLHEEPVGQRGGGHGKPRLAIRYSYVSSCNVLDSLPCQECARVPRGTTPGKSCSRPPPRSSRSRGSGLPVSRRSLPRRG